MCPSQIISLVHELAVAYYSDSDLRYYYTTIQINFPFDMTHVVNSNYLWEGGDPNTIIKCKKKKKKPLLSPLKPKLESLSQKSK